MSDDEESRKTTEEAGDDEKSQKRDPPEWLKYQNMSPEKKRRLYKCGDDYVKLDDILTWTQYFDEQSFIFHKTSKSGKQGKRAFPFNATLNDKISLWIGDITTLEIDAIVNAGLRLPKSMCTCLRQDCASPNPCAHACGRTAPAQIHVRMPAAGLHQPNAHACGRTAPAQIHVRMPVAGLRQPKSMCACLRQDCACPNPCAHACGRTAPAQIHVRMPEAGLHQPKSILEQSGLGQDQAFKGSLSQTFMK
ncbi:hypothetical protein QZH41_005329 [Actinostola sp. cb2023]|nr:hypothetical protein QZH41_005329 [Actinostola sp. cb2023]